MKEARGSSDDRTRYECATAMAKRRGDSGPTGANSRSSAPALPPVFAAWMQPVLKLMRNPRRVLAAPQTALDRIEQEVKASTWKALDGEPLDAQLNTLLDALPSTEEEVRRSIREGVESDRAKLRAEPAGEQLLALYDDADQAGPIAPVKFVLGRPEEETADIWTVMGKLDAAQRTRGERRFLIHIDAIPDLLEKVYRRHLRTTWVLLALARGQWPSSPKQQLGSLVSQLTPQLGSFPALIDHDAGRLRNAVAHRHFLYLPQQRSMRFWNPHPKWEIEIPREAFEAKLRHIWRLATTLTLRLRAIATTEFFICGPLLTRLMLMRDAARGSAQAAKRLEQEDFHALFKKRMYRLPFPPNYVAWFERRSQEAESSYATTEKEDV